MHDVDLSLERFQSWRKLMLNPENSGKMLLEVFGRFSAEEQAQILENTAEKFRTDREKMRELAKDRNIRPLHRRLATLAKVFKMEGRGG